MSQWDERFTGHPVWEAIQALDTALALANASLADAELVEAHTRVSDALRVIREGLQSVDPGLAPIAALERISNDLIAAATAVKSFADTGNRDALTTLANQSMDAILDREFSLSAGGVATDELQESVVSFRRSAGQHMRNLEEQSSSC